MDFIRNSFKNLFRKKLRTSLTVAGIGIGVMSVVIISVIGEVGKYTLNTELNSMGIGGFCVQASENGNSKLFGESELNAVREDVNVEGATPLITKMININLHGLMSRAIAWGVDETAPDIVSLELLHGRLFYAEDINTCKPVCVVDKSLAQLFYHRDNIVGKTLSIKFNNQYVDFTVIGVVSSGGNILKEVMGSMVPTFLYVPFTTLSRYSGSTKFSQIIAKISPHSDEKSAEESITSLLSRKMFGAEKIKIENLNSQKDKLNNILNIVTMVLSAIGGISLLVAGLSIMTVMLVSVHERTREIGIKKSIGANRRTIMMEFLTEAFLLSLTGGVVGTLAGILMGLAGCMILKVEFVINYTAIIFCVLFSVAIGVLFGAYPAFKAAKLKPVDALRCE